ncbi:hypothetical protein SEA_NICEHOUSE_80 [Rhodococcus phage NiceHouse]|nr:hypothetical protein SEA_NICEHOUSE_80 [Rhodococcus phage NiceHouse]
MITQETEIYVVGKGFVNPEELTIGSQVHTLDLNREPGVSTITGLTSDFLSGKVCCIDSGAHNVDVTDDTRLLYHSERHGTALISFDQIPVKSPDKRWIGTKYLPVLSWPKDNGQNCSLQELEHIARMCAVHEYDRTVLQSVVEKCTHVDAMILIDMLEFWCSVSPGDGSFGRVSVKSRSHVIKDKYFLDELTRIAVLAGYTAAHTNYSKFTYGLKISYESMPIPGSRPKNQKYFRRYYTGMLYNINASNLPILGMSKRRAFYLPTTSTLNMV